MTPAQKAALLASLDLRLNGQSETPAGIRQSADLPPTSPTRREVAVNRDEPNAGYRETAGSRGNQNSGSGVPTPGAPNNRDNRDFGSGAAPAVERCHREVAAPPGVTPVGAGSGVRAGQPAVHPDDGRALGAACRPGRLAIWDAAPWAKAKTRRDGRREQLTGGSHPSRAALVRFVEKVAEYASKLGGSYAA